MGAVIHAYRLLATVLFPLYALAGVLHPRLRKHLGERLGGLDVEVEPGAVWIHAASLGEGRAAEALIAALRAAHKDVGVLRTCTSDVARDQEVGADQTSCLPFDVPLLVGGWLDRVRPRCLVLVEADLWPALIWACGKRGIPVAVVGAKAGKGTRRLLKAIPWIRGAVRWIPADGTAASIYGGSPIGDLKRGAPARAASLTWDREAVVAGCTHEGEERVLLEAVAQLEPRPLLILAPRDPRRFDGVAAALSARGERYVRRTRLDGVVPEDADVVLLDTIGELAGLYARARAAFVGGTFFARIGGHSPAEAAAVGCPVVHGPFTGSNAAAWAGLDTFPALTPDELPDALVRAMNAPAHRPPPPADAGPRAMHALAPLLRAPTPPERALRPWLWPLVPLWRLGVALRPRPAVRAPIPVISVGALTAGGSGKTPVAGWLAERLAARSPAIVSRGYGRRRGNDVRTEGEAGELGDELVMLRRRGHRVVSSPDRLAGVVAAAKAGAGIALLDDALQVGQVAKDLEIVVVDARWPRGGGPIPVGTARVPLDWLERADVVWVNHGPLPDTLRPHVREGAVVVQARYRPVAWLIRGKRIPLGALPPRPAAAFAGIARPEGFFRAVRALGIRLARTWVFPDHHPYGWPDLQAFEAWLDDHVVITTEKDAARLPPDSAIHALCMDVEIVEGREALDRVLAPFLGA